MSSHVARGVLSVSFNQDHSCFTCATRNGFRVFNVDPFSVQLRAGIESVGSLARVEMLDRSNIMALIAGGSLPKFPENAVMIYDDSRPEDKLVAEIMCAQPVLAVKLKRDKLVVVLRNQLHVFSFPNPITKLATIETRDNPKGICQLSPAPDNQLMVFPAASKVTGVVQLLDLNSSELTQPDQTKAPVTLHACNHDLACLSINQQGTLIATASTTGTLVRLFDTVSRKKVKEFRRGTDRATIYCISFSHDSAFMCVASDKGTIHIFSLTDDTLNQSCVGFVKSMCTFSIQSECPCICAFGPQQSIYAICVDGTYHKYIYTCDKTDKRAPNLKEYDLFWDGGDDEIVF